MIIVMIPQLITLHSTITIIHNIIDKIDIQWEGRMATINDEDNEICLI